MGSLSDRVRAGSEAAPWVADEIARLEGHVEAALAEVALLRATQRQYRASTERLLAVIAALMPGARHIAIQDYAELNNAPFVARKLLEESECGGRFVMCDRDRDELLQARAEVLKLQIRVEELERELVALEESKKDVERLLVSVVRRVGTVQVGKRLMARAGALETDNERDMEHD